MTTATSTSRSRAATSAAALPPSQPSPHHGNVSSGSSINDDDDDDDMVAVPPRVALSGGPSGNGLIRASSSSPQPNGGGGPGSAGQAPPPPRSSSTRPNLSRNGTGTGTGTGPDHEQTLRDKNLRISALERELDSLSHNESERAAFFQSQHSSLHQQFMCADNEMRLLRAEVDLRGAERDELRRDWDAARRDLAARECEVVDLRAQVRGLKDWLANSTRSTYGGGGGGGDVPADDVFADGFSRLLNGLQNWIINNFRRTRLDLSHADADILEELSLLAPTYKDLVQDAKLPLLQSLVSRILVESVFDSYFFGLSNDQTKQLAQVEALMDSYVDDPESVNQWRASTLTMISRNASHKMQEELARQTDAVVERINRLLLGITTEQTAAAAAAASARTALRGPSPSPPDPAARDASLRQLITAAIDLARQLSVQRALFRVFMPSTEQQTAFDPTKMEDVGGLLDEDALAAGPAVRCATFPGVVKRGDEKGGNLQRYENVISKARVLCHHPED